MPMQMKDSILDALPHYHPFVMVDKVVEIGDNTITTIKNVTMTEPWFPGHFPEYPIMPGVLLLEAMAQSAALLAGKEDLERGVRLLGFEDARFKKEVRPGDQVIITATSIQETQIRGMKISKYKATAKVDGTLVARCVLTAAVPVGDD
ncbi:3-hydroxyacyl-ACP dehydratase FabZ [bacterium]|nr:3-hydroxyacyl-ACP dehydratase FabZ [bacterium]